MQLCFLRLLNVQKREASCNAEFLSSCQADICLRLSLVASSEDSVEPIDRDGPRLRGPTLGQSGTLKFKERRKPFYVTQAEKCRFFASISVKDDQSAVPWKSHGPSHCRPKSYGTDTGPFHCLFWIEFKIDH